MARITITIADDVLAELRNMIAVQASRAAAQFGGNVPPEVAMSVEAWIGGILEQNISQMLADVIRTPDAERARIALQQARRDLVKAASGIRSIDIEKDNADRQS